MGIMLVRVPKLMPHLISAYLYVIVPVVVQIEDAVDLAVRTHVQVVGALDALADRLARVLLHLDVVELAAKSYKNGGGGDGVIRSEAPAKTRTKTYLVLGISSRRENSARLCTLGRVPSVSSECVRI